MFARKTGKGITLEMYIRNSSKGGTWRRELLQRPWRDVAQWLASPPFSGCSLVEPRTTSPGMAPPTMGCALPH